MSGSKAKGKSRASLGGGSAAGFASAGSGSTGPGSASRPGPKRPSIFASSSSAPVSRSASNSNHSSDTDNNNASSMNDDDKDYAATDANDMDTDAVPSLTSSSDIPPGIEEFGSLLPGKSDTELSYHDIIASLNQSISSSSPANSKFTISDAIPAKRDLISLRYDLSRMLRVSIDRINDCEKSITKLKRLSTAIDRESDKRVKLSRTEVKPESPPEDAKASSAQKESAAPADKTTSRRSSKQTEPRPDLITIKTEASDTSSATSLPTDTTGLFEPDTRYKSPPEYEKNPKSEFVTSQELPIAALNLFEDQIKGLPTSGQEYLLKRYAVASYPPDDLKDWLPGEIPDHDFTKAKPPNQVQFSTFSSYIEPYFRPFNEDDALFLKQKLIGGPYGYAFLANTALQSAGASGSGSGSGGSGNNHGSSSAAAALAAANAAAAKRAQLSPYVVPKLGPLYSEVWREQDGKNPGYTLNPPAAPSAGEVQARGASDAISDANLEREDISCGPLASRLLSALMSEDDAADDSDEAGKTGSDDSKAVIKREPGDGIKLEAVAEEGEDEEANMKDDSKGRSVTLENTNWTIGTVTTDFNSLEERLKREFKYVGILDINMLRKEEQRKAEFEELAGPPVVPVPPAVANSKLAAAYGKGNHGHGHHHAAAHERDGDADSDKKKISSSSGSSSSGSRTSRISGGGGKPEEFEIDWVNGREDDEISTELRYLQKQLRHVSRFNWACQRVLYPVVEEQLAWQEYTQILDDLDKQVDQAYLRRNRTTTRVKKKKGGAAAAAAASSQHAKNSGKANGGSGDGAVATAPGTPSGASTGAPSTAIAGGAAAGAAPQNMDQAQRLKQLLDKRMRWVNSIGPVFRTPRELKGMPRESIFQQARMDELLRLGSSMDAHDQQRAGEAGAENNGDNDYYNGDDEYYYGNEEDGVFAGLAGKSGGGSAGDGGTPGPGASAGDGDMFA